MNVSAAALVSTLNGFFSERGAVPTGMRLSWAESSEGKFLAGLAMFLDRRVDAREPLSYRSVRLLERWYSTTEGCGRLGEMLVGSDQGAKTEPAPTFQPTLWGDRYLLGHQENYSAWPEWVLTARLGDKDAQTPQPNGAAVGLGLRPFESVGRAIEWWLFGEGYPSHGGEARHLRELLIVVPDSRGLLANARWEGNRISGTIHSLGSHDALELQVSLETDSGNELLEPLRPAPSAFAWDVPENARRAEIFLVHESGELMGRARVAPGSAVSALEHRLSVTARAENDLANGEGARVEFKPFLFAKDDKELEVLSSVVAFANTDGGRIYLGVRNDGEPEGAAALNRALKGSGPEAERKYLAQIDGLVRERLKPVPLFSVEFIQVGGARILVIAVDKGDDQPYCTKEGNHVFIRKGASNMRPDPKTEMPTNGSRTLLSPNGPYLDTYRFR